MKLLIVMAWFMLPILLISGCVDPCWPSTCSYDEYKLPPGPQPDSNTISCEKICNAKGAAYYRLARGNRCQCKYAGGH